jgi:hypothetical protein
VLAIAVPGEVMVFLVVLERGATANAKTFSLGPAVPITALTTGPDAEIGSAQCGGSVAMTTNGRGLGSSS